MKWLQAIPAVAAVVGLVGGLVTAISGGQLLIALYVIGVVGGGTIPLAGLLIFVILAGHYLPFVNLQERGNVSNAETFWAYYVAFWALVGALITWVAVDESSFEGEAKDFNIFHGLGIGLLVIGLVAVGVFIQSAVIKRSRA
jgi:hypothetical protein